MSKLVVTAEKIQSVTKHWNADTLDIIEVTGWQTIYRTGVYKVGDLAIYVRPDSLMPKELSDALGVTQYLKNGNRVRSTKLRQEPSHGLLISQKFMSEHYGIDSLVEGEDYAEILGIEKYIPSISPNVTGIAPEKSGFPRYTDIENLRNFPRMFNPHPVLEGVTSLVATEKIHGTNSRVGWVDGAWIAGSHRTVKLEPTDPEEYHNNLYWYPLSLKEVKEMIYDLSVEADDNDVIVYGEIYGVYSNGKMIQPLTYGKNETAYVVFDIMVRGKFLPFSEVVRLCDMYGIPHVPILYTFPTSHFDPEKNPDPLKWIKAISSGTTEIIKKGKTHIREGVVIRPLDKEVHHPTHGRLIAKYISDEYLAGNFEDIEES